MKWGKERFGVRRAIYKGIEIRRVQKIWGVTYYVGEKGFSRLDTAKAEICRKRGNLS